MTSMKRVLLALAAVVVLAFGWATPLGAQTAALSLSPSNGPSPTETTASGLGFLGVGPVHFTVDGVGAGNATADAGGIVSLGVTIAGNAGPRVVEACQADADGTPCAFVASATFTLDLTPTTTTSTTTTTTSTTTTTLPPPTTTTSTTTTTTTATVATTSTTTTTTTIPATTTTTLVVAVAPIGEEEAGGDIDPSKDPSSAAPVPGDDEGVRRIWPYIAGLGLTALLGLGALARRTGGRSGGVVAGPSPGGPVPIPYPNVADSAATKTTQRPETDFDFVSRAAEEASSGPVKPEVIEEVAFYYNKIQSPPPPPPPPPEPDVVDPGDVTEASPAENKYPENMQHKVREHGSADPDDLGRVKMQFPADAGSNQLDLEDTSGGDLADANEPSGMKMVDDPHAADSGGKGGTEGMNIGVRELQETPGADLQDIGSDTNPPGEQEGKKGGNIETTWKVEEGDG